MSHNVTQCTVLCIFFGGGGEGAEHVMSTVY